MSAASSEFKGALGAGVSERGVSGGERGEDGARRGRVAAGSVSGRVAQPRPTVRQPLDGLASSAELCQEVVGVCTADPLRRMRHFQHPGAQLRSEDRGFLPAFLP